MKILQLTWSLDKGGAEKFTVELSNELADIGHEVTLCTIKSITPEMLPAKMIAGNVKLLVLNAKKKYSLTLCFKLLRLINTEKYDVVHVHSGFLVFYIHGFSLFTRVKIVHTIHNTLTKGYLKLYNLLSRTSINPGRIYHICISKNILEDYTETYPRFRFYHIDNGIYPLSITPDYESVKAEIGKLKPSENTKIFLAIGNYSVYKNFTCLTNVFKQLEEEGHDIILIILGYDRSPGREQYNKVYHQKGTNTHLLGQRENVADYIAMADALVISSLKEGMPLVALEAFSMGKPVISTPVGGMVDVIEQGKNGFLSASFSKESLLQMVKKYLSLNNSEIAGLNRRSLESFESYYHINKCAFRYLQLYAEKQS